MATDDDDAVADAADDDDGDHGGDGDDVGDGDGDDDDDLLKTAGILWDHLSLTSPGRISPLSLYCLHHFSGLIIAFTINGLSL